MINLNCCIKKELPIKNEISIKDFIDLLMVLDGNCDEAKEFLISTF